MDQPQSKCENCEKLKAVYDAAVAFRDARKEFSRISDETHSMEKSTPAMLLMARKADELCAAVRAVGGENA